MTKLALSRRTLLRGLGAAISLPLLDAMVPALTPIVKTAARPTPRLGFIYTPNGFIQEEFIPAKAGLDYEITPSLKALEPYRKDITVISGLANREAESRGNTPGPHSRACAAWLTGTHCLQTEGADVRAGTSADQIAAAVLGRETAVPSLELAIEQNERMIGNCEPGYSCVYQNTISWRSPTTPMPLEMHPRVVFDRLFGDGSTPDELKAQLRTRNSVLDYVTEEIADLRKVLGPGDRNTFAEYLDSVREVESRIQRAEARTGELLIDLPPRPADIPSTFEAHVKLMFDLQALAYRADITRVIAFQLSRELSPRTYPEIGVRGAHHYLSHHGDNPEKIADKAKIDAYHVQMLSYYIEKLAHTPDGDGTLLDNVLVLYGTGFGQSNRHEPVNIANILIGRGRGSVRSGRHLMFPVADDVPEANLLVSLLDKVGVPVDQLGNSTGRLEGLTGL